MPLESPPHEIPVPPLDTLRAHRKQYSELLLEKMRAPDGSYDETFVVPGLTIPRRNAKPPTDLETNNPLSLHDEVGGAFACDHLTIVLMVCIEEPLEGMVCSCRSQEDYPARCRAYVSPLPKDFQFAIYISSSCSFPDIGYFRDDDVQQQLTNILFLYAVMHPDIEYRQGMHELLAPVYYAVGM